MISFVKKALTAALSCASAAVLMFTSSMPLNNGILTAEAADTSTISNPFIWSDVPDPDIIRVGDTYYMVSTTMFFDPGVPVMKSKDLMSWEICNYVYDTLGAGDRENLTQVNQGNHMYAKGSWAASLRYNKGTYYVFFGSYSTNKSYIFKTTDIENGTWTKSEIPGMYHDASILFDDDGRNYLVYGGGEIKVKELNSEMTGFKSGGLDKTLFKTNIQGYVSGEGSHIQKINNKYYIFIIAWPMGSGRTEYCYRSDKIDGWYDSKTVLSDNGVAQGGIVDTPDGDWYGLLFRDSGGVGRIPYLVPVHWQDNWPMMGDNGKVPKSFTVEGGYAGTFLAKSDEFDYTSNELMLEWQWNHAPDNTAWSVTDRPGWLRLTNKQMANNLLNARNTLTMRTEGPACRSVIKMDTKNMKDGDYAGLSAFQFKYGNVGVYVSGGQKKVFMSENGGDKIENSSNKIVQETNLSGDEVYFKIDFNFNNDKANFYWSTDGSNWQKIGKEISMPYDLTLFTGYRSAIFSYPTKNLGGYVDVDYFEYERDDWNLPTVVTPVGPDENGYYFHDTYEGSTNSWAGRGSAKVETAKDEHFEGEGSIYVSGREASWHGAQKKLNSRMFRPASAYSFSTNVKYTEGPDEETFLFSFQYTDTEGTTQWPHIAEVTAKKGEWAQLANTAFEIPAGATDMYIYVETKDEDSTTSFYVDDTVGAVEGTKIQGAEPATEPPTEPPVVAEPGDLNDDGVINCIDIILAKRVISGAMTDKKASLAADIDDNGTVNSSDIQYILWYLTKQTSILRDTPRYLINDPPIIIDDPVLQPIDWGEGGVVID